MTNNLNVRNLSFILGLAMTVGIIICLQKGLLNQAEAILLGFGAIFGNGMMFLMDHLILRRGYSRSFSQISESRIPLPPLSDLLYAAEAPDVTKTFDGEDSKTLGPAGLVAIVLFPVVLAFIYLQLGPIHPAWSLIYLAYLPLMLREGRAFAEIENPFIQKILSQNRKIHLALNSEHLWISLLLLSYKSTAPQIVSGYVQIPLREIKRWRILQSTTHKQQYNPGTYQIFLKSGHKIIVVRDLMKPIESEFIAKIQPELLKFDPELLLKI